MIDQAINFMSEWFGVAYWVAFSVCGVFYTWKSVLEYITDKRKLDEYMKAKNQGNPAHYYPTITVGSLVARTVAATLPIFNVLAAAFDVTPHIYKVILKSFDWALVPHPNKIR